MKKKAFLTFAVIAVLVLGLVCKNQLIRAYVRLFHEDLETYAEELLADGARRSDRYGRWKTSCYPEDGMVEFSTGGFGLAPSAVYRGFYYSRDNTHQLFSAAYEAETAMEIDGDEAFWTDGTDNHGTSRRLRENWFWYEAAF